MMHRISRKYQRSHKHGSAISAREGDGKTNQREVMCKLCYWRPAFRLLFYSKEPLAENKIRLRHPCGATCTFLCYKVTAGTSILLLLALPQYCAQAKTSATLLSTWHETLMLRKPKQLGIHLYNGSRYAQSSYVLIQ